MLPNEEESGVVLSLIKEVGINRLGHFEGCTCCHFKVRNINIDVCCGKGGVRGVTIYTKSLDYYPISWKDAPDDLYYQLLRPIGEEVACQVEVDGRGTVPVYVKLEGGA